MVIDQSGIVRYRGAGVNTDDIQSWINQLLATSIGDNKDLPYSFNLSQNYPNPFNPGTRIGFEIPQSGHVSLQVFDMQGRLVNTLLNSEMRVGQHSVSWNGLDISGMPVVSGVYIYRLRTNTQQQTKKMTLIR